MRNVEAKMGILAHVKYINCRYILGLQDQEGSVTQWGPPRREALLKGRTHSLSLTSHTKGTKSWSPWLIISLGKLLN